MLRLMLIMVALLIVAPVYAQAPEAKSTGYQAAGAPAAARRQVFPTANAAAPLRLASGVAACFPFDALISLKAKGGEAVGVLAMTSTLTFADSVNSDGALQVSDTAVPATNGDGAGFTLAAGEKFDIVPRFVPLYRAPGARAGVCSGRQVGPGRYSRAVPCRVNGDCTDAGAGSTCDTASDEAGRLQTLRAQGCAFIVVQVDTANTSITWEMQQ
jgi:hypothetical protein